MRRFTLCCCAVVLVGCNKPKEQPAMDTTAAAPEAPAGPAPIALADVAGKWSVRVMPESGDSTLLTYELVATADPSGWTLNFPKRPPVPARVTAAGDSIVTEAGPYESVLRKGVQVTTNGVMRLVDGKLVGTTTAHYAASGADSVLSLRFEGTRAP
ncbi:MAG TPA: hypothetical protein VFN40_07890 [Gemmatimonadales bacterium]|nr:hypothetical protein [Gemmatimonadales bacterium]